MEAQEVTEETLERQPFYMDEQHPEPTQDDYQLINMIKGIKEASRQEVQVEVIQKDALIEKLQVELLQLREQLEPLLKFEPILSKDIPEPMPIRLYDLSDSDKEKLLVLCREFYKSMGSKFDNHDTPIGRGRDPLNQMISDLITFLLIGPMQQCMMRSFFKSNKQRGLIINDK